MKEFTGNCSEQIERLRQALGRADSILIGAGAGLSASAGLAYSGKRFEQYFSDFHQKYGITDMYSGGFYPFDTLEEYWAWWSHHVFYNRYVEAPIPVYRELLALVQDKDYFVLTTNVDHQFQRAGFDKKRLFYTQGDYGLWQCSKACHNRTYDNEDAVRQMIAEQQDMRIPTELIPRCPVCGAPITMNLRCDETFVQDAGWYAAQSRYSDWRFDRSLVSLFRLRSRHYYRWLSVMENLQRCRRADIISAASDYGSRKALVCLLVFKTSVGYQISRVGSIPTYFRQKVPTNLEA